LVAASVAAGEAHAADADAQPTVSEPGDDVVPLDSDIVVYGGALRGSVDTPQPPVMTLDAEDVEAYGAASLGELVEAISPQTGSGRGRSGERPVMLINGQRVSSFRELRSIPPEAIRRLEVLPEEVALRFGYPPDQRVINFILKDNFSTVTAAGEYNVPTRGGFTNSEIEAGTTRINGPSRLNLEVKIVDDTMLTESERGTIQQADTLPSVAGDPDPAAARSLVDDSVQARAQANWSTGLGKDGQGGSLSLNATATRNKSRSLFGLDTVLLTSPDGDQALRTFGDPLTRQSNATTLQGGATLNKGLGDWQLSATIDASHVDTTIRTDRESDVSGLVAAAADGSLAIDGALPGVANAGRDRSRSKDLTVESLITLTGRPFVMPAGEATLTLRAGLDYARSRNSDTRSGLPSLTLKRRDAATGFNLGLPITSRREGFGDAIGDLSLNVSAGINDLSDYGTLTEWNVGLSWNPTEKLALQASYIANEAAPSLSNLGDPELAVFNVPVFDFTRGETTQVTIFTGGNPDLRKEKQRDIKLSANWEVPIFQRSNLIVEYFRNRSDDVTRAFPLLTPAIEAVFADRVVRDADGRLISIDRRPITYDHVSSERIRWGLNVSGQIADKSAGAGNRGEARRGGRGGPPGMGGGRPGGGRWNLSAYHSYRIDETVRIAADGPVLDLLGGDALSDGGVARHSFEVEGGVFHKGFGLRMSADWSAPVTVRASGAPGTSDLRFGSVFNVDLRFFVNLGMMDSVVEKYPFTKGMRVLFTVDNLFDSRQKVTDPFGDVPLSYQADYRDPRGRVVGIDLRKMF
jgi:hypothetical protein